MKLSSKLRLAGLLLLGSASLSAQMAQAESNAKTPVAASGQDVGKSPWGPEDEIGRLNLITPESQAAILSRIKGGKVYDLATDYYVGMPSWQAAGDPHYQFWMTHTPRGTEVDDPMGVGQEMNAARSYTGTAFSMYSHTGTHIDALNHFGIHGKIWNGFKADEHLGDRGWKRAGIEKFPPLIARGVMIDIAAAKGVDMLPDGYRITRQDIKDALARQKSALQKGDIVLIRTGRMKLFNDPDAYIANPPGMGLDAARYLVEEGGAMVLGADNLSFEAFPSEVPDDYVPLHTYLLAQQGAPIIELVALDELSRDKVYEFAFIGGPLKIRGGDAAPLRPVALPIQATPAPKSRHGEHQEAPRIKRTNPAIGYLAEDVFKANAFTQTIRAGNTLYLSGIAPLRGDLNHLELVGEGSMQAQTEFVLETLKRNLAAEGATLRNLVALTVYVTDIAEYVKLSDVTRQFFGEHTPTSTLVEVKALFHPRQKVEITGIAVLD